MYNLKKCNICPRKCGADRTCGTGYCGQGAEIKIARAAPHYWEEPCISGERGSGTVFFSGCSLRISDRDGFFALGEIRSYDEGTAIKLIKRF